jgi:glycosyltransferase involved in cell wall biosynthesis
MASKKSKKPSKASGSKPKILWSGDIVAMTGFARVTENLITRLKDKYEIVVLGNNWWGDPNPFQKDFVMYPSSNRFQAEPFGVLRIREIVEKEKPDLIFVNNDIWIINQIYEQIKDYHHQEKFRFVGYFPVDSYGWTSAVADYANLWDGLISYTEFGANEFIKSGIQKPITVIPHGITEGQFRPGNKAEARKRLGLKQEDFIVFNGNRNQPRKRIDITIQAFAAFAVGKPNTKLYLHMGKKDQGWDVMSLFGREMLRNSLDPNGRIIMTADSAGPPNVNVEMLNTIYNAVDVGINTCRGEGHGLVNHEHAACQVAQLVPDHTSCKEIFEGCAPLIRCDHRDVDPNFNRDMWCPSAEHLQDLLTNFYYVPKNLEDAARRCYDRATDPMYQWDNIAVQFDEAFQEALKGSFEVVKSPDKPVLPVRI